MASLTGVRAVAALLVLGTHAAYTTGKYTHGFAGLLYSRMEIGVPIFFVLSGYLLFGPWVRAAARGGQCAVVARYAWHRVRRIMPAYVVTVVLAFLIYHFRTAGPNPGHSWIGLVPQPDPDADLHRQLHVLLSAPRTYADVEPGGRGGVLRRAAASWPTFCWWCCAVGSGDRTCCWPGWRDWHWSARRG